MRMTLNEKNIIHETIHHLLGEDVRIWVYGSRLNEDSKGGDLDLLLESPANISVLQRAELKRLLERELQMPVDLLIWRQGTKPSAFQSIALAKAVLLESAA